MSDVYGYASFIDTTHISLFEGYIGYSGYAQFLDTTHLSLMTGLSIIDSSHILGDTTYYQNQILGPSDMTLTLADWTYAHGHPNIDGTWVDGTFDFRNFDATQIYYSVYYQNYDTSDFSLVGYKFREPARTNVGQYYASMVTPDTAGHYENRWTYLKDESSYAHRKIQSFVGMSKGLDYMPDYPGTGDNI